ncbi:MAG: alpha/beta hydrolase domain-containing protein [Pirellulaceae bacterium]|nr:alpha/beta hydrolase domain-containing protein [Pirellulaceae bacterium]
MRWLWKAIACAGGLFVAAAASGEVTRWEVVTREPYAGGKEIGDRGPCERWAGVVHFALDPTLPANRGIVDLDLAPKNDAGKVEFSADFELLLPRDRTKLNGALYYEVNNRGGRTGPRIIDGGADDFLLRQGFIVAASGWLAEVQPGDGKLRLQAPLALQDGKPLVGIVREEVIVEKAVPRASLAHRGNQGRHPPTAKGLETAVLTRRELERDPRQVVPKDQWRMVSSVVSGDGRSGQLPLIELEVDGNLQPGWIYEVVYEAEGSLVQGAGLAGIRDFVSCLKFDQTDNNPLRDERGQPLVHRAIGFGTSQSGRLLRHFLYEDFNADEHGRQVLDGVISHVAGGGLGSFNQRFASPTRTNGQHEEHLFAADYFPFTYGDERDPFSGRTGGILKKPRASKTVPKVFHTQSSSEYWHRSGSLVHTDPLATRDAEVPPEVRIYTFGGTQHGAGSGIVGAKGGNQLPSNPADYRPLLRALIMAMDAWVKDGQEPPPSVYPRIADGTLAGWRKNEAKWPEIPGINYPEVVHQPHFLDRGPLWNEQRIATIEPPTIKGDYVVKVPAYDADGNERGTLQLPALAVPVATYTSWNLRDAAIGAKGELVGLQGGYIPFLRTQAEREAAKDPRPALLERYRDFADYRQRYLESGEKLLAGRYLLAEELPRLKALCEQFEPVFGN